MYTREISVSEVRELPVGGARKMSGRPGLLPSLTGVDHDTAQRDSGGEKQAIKAEVLECVSLVRGVGAGLLWVGVAHIRRGICNAGQRRFCVDHADLCHDSINVRAGVIHNSFSNQSSPVRSSAQCFAYNIM